MRNPRMKPGREKNNLCKNSPSPFKIQSQTHTPSTEVRAQYSKHIGKKSVASQIRIRKNTRRKSALAHQQGILQNLPPKPRPNPSLQLRDRGNPSAGSPKTARRKAATMRMMRKHLSPSPDIRKWALMTGGHQNPRRGPGTNSFRPWILSKRTTKGTCGPIFFGRIRTRTATFTATRRN